MDSQYTIQASNFTIHGSHIKKQATSVPTVNVNNDNGYSQCETIYDGDDDEMTEEENDFEDKGDHHARDEEEQISDPSSTCNSETTEEDVPLSRRSVDIEDLLQKMPNITQDYHILSKIGEGTLFQRICLQ